jgi:3D (Asp-Asp-Asp) domain-containing protein
MKKIESFLFSLFCGLCFVVLFTPEIRSEEYNAILTAYCPCQSCCSWHYGEDGKPKFNLRPNVTKIIGQTASGTIAQANHTLAAPKGYHFGTKIYIDFHGHNVLLGVVEDRGGAIHAKDGIVRIDVYFHSHKEALKFGRRKVMIALQELPDMDLTEVVSAEK